MAGRVSVGGGNHGRAGGLEALRGGLPPAHLEFLEGLLPWFIADRFLLVHAGIRPGRPLEQQVSEDILWIREEFIHKPHDLPHTVVFGHTPRREIFVDLPYKIGIDTGCVYGGRLTAIELTEGVVYQGAPGERQGPERARRAPRAPAPPPPCFFPPSPPP